MAHYYSAACHLSPATRQRWAPSRILQAIAALLILQAAAARAPAAPWFSLHARESALKDARDVLPAGLADDLHTLVDLARQCCSNCFDHHVLHRYALHRTSQRHNATQH